MKKLYNRESKQRYRCRPCRQGRGRTFLLDYADAGHSAEAKQQIVEMAMNASAIRDTARVLHVRPTDERSTLLIHPPVSIKPGS